MAVLKANQFSQRPRSAVVLDMASLGREAEQYKSEAIAEIDAYREHIEQQAEAERRQMWEEACVAGFEAGHRTGYEQGLEQAKRDVQASWHEPFQQVHQLLADLTGRLQQVVEGVESQLEQETLQFMLAAAQALVYRTIEVDPNVVQNQLLQAIGCLSDEHQVLVRMHPRDREAVEAIFPQVQEMLGERRVVKLCEDDDVPVSGVVVEAGPGRVTANVQTAIQRMVEHLLPFSDVEVGATESADKGANP